MKVDKRALIVNIIIRFGLDKVLDDIDINDLMEDTNEEKN